MPTATDILAKYTVEEPTVEPVATVSEPQVAPVMVEEPAPPTAASILAKYQAPTAASILQKYVPEVEPLKGYAELPEEERRFMPEKTGLRDILNVPSRGSEAIGRILLDINEGRDPWEGMKAELLTPGGITGDEEALERIGAMANDPTLRTIAGLAADVVFDPLNILFGMGVVSKGLGVGGKFAARIVDSSPALKGVQNVVRFTLEEAYRPVGHLFDAQYGIKRGLREGLITEEQFWQYKDFDAIAKGKLGLNTIERNLREAQKVIGGEGKVALDEIKRDAVSHLLSGRYGDSGEILESPAMLLGREVAVGVGAKPQHLRISENIIDTARRVREQTDFFHTRTFAEGFKIGYFPNYVRTLYEKPKASVWATLKAIYDGDMVTTSVLPNGQTMIKAGKPGFLKAKTFRGPGYLAEAKEAGYVPIEDVEIWLARNFQEYNRLMVTEKFKKSILSMGRKITPQDFNVASDLEDFYRAMGYELKPTEALLPGKQKLAPIAAKAEAKLRAAKVRLGKLEAVQRETARQAGAAWTRMKKLGLRENQKTQMIESLRDALKTTSVAADPADLETILAKSVKDVVGRHEARVVKEAAKTKAMSKEAKLRWRYTALRALRAEGRQYFKAVDVDALTATANELSERVRWASETVGLYTKPGESIYVANGIFKTNIQQQNVETLAKVVDAEKGVVMQKLSPRMTKHVIANGGEAYVLPDFAVEMLNRTNYMYSKTGMDEMARQFGRVMGLWKAYALVSPGFDIRNAYGGIFNAYINGRLWRKKSTWRGYDLGAKATAIIMGAGERFAKLPVDKWMNQTIKGKNLNMKFRDLLEETQVYAGIDRGFAPMELGSREIRKLRKLNPLSRDFAPLYYHRAIINSVENFLRSSIYIAERLDGLPPVKAAAKVIESQFDYIYGLTPFEQKLRDFAFPFYTWARFNIPFQLKMLVKVPHRYSRIPKIIHAFEGDETLEEEQYKPDFFREIAAFKSPWQKETPDGTRSFSYYYSPDMPFRELMTAWNLASVIRPGEKGDSVFGKWRDAVLEIGENLGPLPKGIIEHATGWNFFTRRVIPEEEKIAVPLTFKWLPNAMKENLGMKLVKGSGDRPDVWVMHRRDYELMNTLVPPASKINRMFPGQGNRTPEHASSLYSFLLGVKYYASDPEKYRQGHYAKEKRKAQRPMKEAKADYKAAAKVWKTMEPEAPTQEPTTYQPQTAYSQAVLRRLYGQ